MSQKLILIVDDALDMRMLLRKYLEKDYKVLEAITGAMALDILRTTPQIELVLLDIMMPDFDGYETFEAIKKNLPNRKTKIAFLTGKNSKAEILKGMSYQPDDYILKPVDSQLLLSKVEQLLKD